MDRRFVTRCCGAPILQVDDKKEDPNGLKKNMKCCGQPSNAHYHRCSKCGLGACTKQFSETVNT